MGARLIHYHGTPCGGPRQEVARFLAGRHALIPFPSPEDLPTAMEVCQSFCLDNGAFSVWKQGGVLDVPGYVQWCYGCYRHPAFDWALIPDVVAGSEQENDALLSEWPNDIRGVPVWHLHESLDRLDRLVGEWPTVAFGSSGQWPTPATDGWWCRMTEAMAVACDVEGRPRCRLHGLRMLDNEICRRIPFASADSTNAVRNSSSYSRFGMYCPPNAGTRMAIIAERIESEQSAPVWVPSFRHQTPLLELAEQS